MTNTLFVDNATLTYPDGAGRVTALDRVTVTVPGGSVAAVTGPSGSGKSSLLAVVATLIRPDSGSIFLDSGAGRVDLAALSRRAAADMRRNMIGIVFQQANLIPALTAVEQLMAMDHLGQQMLTTPARRRRVRAEAMALLDSVGLAEHAGKRPAQLSGGQRQRVNIARALMNDPALLLIDEPTSALDSERGAAIIDLLLEVVRDHRAATLLATHDRAHLPRMDAVYRMVDGVLSDEQLDGSHHPVRESIPTLA